MSRNDGQAVVTGATQIGGVVGASEHVDGERQGLDINEHGEEGYVS